MKPKSNPFLKSTRLAALIIIACGTAAHAATFYWDGTSGNWDDVTKWSTDLAGTTDPAARPLASASDVLNFNTTPGNAATSTLYLNGARGSSSNLATMNFNTSGATTLLGGLSGTPANNNLFIGTFTVNSGSGAVTIGDTAASPTAQVNLKSGSISFTNNSTSLLTLANGLNSYGSGSTTTLTFTGSGNISSGGVIGNGTGTNVVAVTKTGAGMLTLSGLNTYSGTTAINDGIARITNNNALGATNNGTTVASTVTARLELANGITTSSNEALTISARTTNEASLSNFSGNNTWAGTINTATGGGLYNLESQAGLLSISGNLVNGNTGNRTWQLMGAGDGAISGTIADGSGTVFVTKYSGSGTWTLSVANSYSGATTVSNGVLRITNDNALGNTTGATNVTAGSLELASGITTHSLEALTISGSGDNFIGALRAGTGGGTWAGQVSLGSAPRIGATAGNTLTITGSIVNGSGSTFAVSGQSGTGVVVINPTTSNTYTGATQIIRGTLRLGKTDALPTGTILDVDSSSSVTDAAVFDLANFNQTVAGLQDGATSSINGKITNSVPATTSTLTLNQSTNSFYDGVIENGAGTVALIKDGSGRITLNGVNTYTGATSVNVGRLNIGGSLASPVTVASGAAIGGEGTSSNSLTFGAGTSTLFFDPATPGALAVSSVVTTGATVLVAPEGTTTEGGTYVVLTNSAGFSGTPDPVYVPGSRGTLAFGGTGNTELQFTAAAAVASLKWRGTDATNPSFWDVNTTANWFNGTTSDVFFNFDPVEFDDSATTTTVAIQNASVTVAGLAFNNTLKNYTVSGGSIGGATAALTKSGTGSLTLANANTFGGGSTLNEGTLNINNTSALGAAAGGFVFNGGSIDNTSGSAITTVNYPLTINADLPFTGSNDLNLGNGATTLGTTTATSRTITTTAGTLRLGGAISNGSGGANGIVKTGNGTLTLASAASSYTGLTTVSAGTLKLGASGTSATACPLGANAAGTEVSSGATLDFGGFKAYAEAITITGTGVGGNGALINSGADQINAVESLTLSANASIGGNGGRFDIRTNSAPATLNMANHTLTKSGSCAVALVGTAVTPGSGHIDITGGALSIQTTTAMNGSSANTITVRNSATLDCYQSGVWTAPVWSVLMDAGSNFTNSNGTVAWDGTVTLNGAANLGGGANLAINSVIDGASGSIIKTGVGTLTLAGSTANTYGGTTTVNAGTLALNKTAGNAIPGNVTVTTTGTMTNSADNQIADSAAITVDNTGAAWNLGNKTETVTTLNLSGAYTANKGFTTGVAGKLTVTNLNVAGGGVTLNSSGVGQESYIDANTVTNTGGTWVFGITNGTQSLRVGSGGLTIGGGSTIAVNAAAGTADNYISLGGNVSSTAAAATNTISGLGTLRLNATRTFTVADDTPASDLTISTVIANGSGTGGLTKEGPGTLILNAANTYNGTTAVNAGTLGGTGSIAGPVTVGSSGTVAPGTSTGTLTVAAADFSAGGTLAIEVNDASTPRTDLLVTTGALNLTNAKLQLIVTGTPAQTSYTIATAGSITGTFAPANVSGLPSGYALAYTATEVKLVKGGFASWITNPTFGLLPADQDPTDDPDGDGENNITEFALDGNPASGADTGKVVGKIASVGGVPTLVLTLPVRGAGTTFTQPGSPGDGTQVSALVDDVIYKIQNSNALASWTLNVTEIPAGADKTAIESTMPGLSSSDWTYRTFRSSGSVSSNPKKFLRAAIVTP